MEKEKPKIPSLLHEVHESYVRSLALRSRLLGLPTWWNKEPENQETYHKESNAALT